MSKGAVAALVVVALASTIGSIGAQTHHAVLPAVGDVGVVVPCIPGDDDGAEECETCRREEKEDEEGDKDKDRMISATADCIDQCNANGYTITQLAETSETDPDTNETVKYRNLKLVPKVGCANGCHCPNATGMALIVEETDDDKEEPDRYELSFLDQFGKPDGGYLEGELEVEEVDKDGYERINQVNLMIKFMVTEIKQDDDDQSEPVEEKKEEDCRMQFQISAGKVGGIIAKSGAAAPADTEQATGYQGQDLGAINRQALPKGALCTDAEFAENSDDWCMYRCSGAYTVRTVGSALVFVPKEQYITPTCICQAGIGAQIGTDKWMNDAIVSFDETSRTCTSTFDPARAANVTASDANNGKKFTISFSAKGGNATCLYKYNIESDGVVMGYTSKGHISNLGANTGATVLALLMAVMFLVIFIGSTCGEYKEAGRESF